METDTLKSMHEIVKEHVDPKTFNVEAGKVLVLTANQKVVDLEEIAEKHLEHPKRAKGSSVHHTLESLIAHAKAHKTDDTAVYCQLESEDDEVAIVVVYNANPTAAVVAKDGVRGGWRDHRAEYSFPFSDQWKRWTAAEARGQLSVKEFAELIEAGISDVRDATKEKDAPRIPGVTYATPAELLTLAGGLQVHVEQQVYQAVRLDSGTAQITFTEDHKGPDGAPLRIPNGFLLGIPIFLGAETAAPVPVRLRYEVRSKQLLWRVQLHDAEAAKREAITEAAKRVATETGLPLYYGTPE